MRSLSSIDEATSICQQSKPMSYHYNDVEGYEMHPRERYETTAFETEIFIEDEPGLSCTEREEISVTAESPTKRRRFLSFKRRSNSVSKGSTQTASFLKEEKAPRTMTPRIAKSPGCKSFADPSNAITASTILVPVSKHCVVSHFESELVDGIHVLELVGFEIRDGLSALVDDPPDSNSSNSDLESRLNILVSPKIYTDSPGKAIDVNPCMLQQEEPLDLSEKPTIKTRKPSSEEAEKPQLFSLLEDMFMLCGVFGRHDAHNNTLEDTTISHCNAIESSTTQAWVVLSSIMDYFHDDSSLLPNWINISPGNLSNDWPRAFQSCPLLGNVANDVTPGTNRDSDPPEKEANQIGLLWTLVASPCDLFATGSSSEIVVHRNTKSQSEMDTESEAKSIVPGKVTLPQSTTEPTDQRNTALDTFDYILGQLFYCSNLCSLNPLESLEDTEAIQSYKGDTAVTEYSNIRNSLSDTSHSEQEYESVSDVLSADNEEQRDPYDDLVSESTPQLLGESREEVPRQSPTAYSKLPDQSDQNGLRQIAESPVLLDKRETKTTLVYELVDDKLCKAEHIAGSVCQFDGSRVSHLEVLHDCDKQLSVAGQTSFQQRSMPLKVDPKELVLSQLNLSPRDHGSGVVIFRQDMSKPFSTPFEHRYPLPWPATGGTHARVIDHVDTPALCQRKPHRISILDTSIYDTPPTGNNFGHEDFPEIPGIPNSVSSLSNISVVEKAFRLRPQKARYQSSMGPLTLCTSLGMLLETQFRKEEIITPAQKRKKASQKVKQALIIS